MGAIQEIFRRHGSAYRAQFGETMPASHARVIEAITDCRSAASGSVLYQCEDCGEPHVVARCCGNRHCPVCQQGKAEVWLSRQLERQLPTPYFMLTFTVPAHLRKFLRRHPREGYGALFAVSGFRRRFQRWLNSPHLAAASTSLVSCGRILSAPQGRVRRQTTGCTDG